MQPSNYGVACRRSRGFILFNNYVELVSFHKWSHAQSKGAARVLVRRKDAKAKKGAMRVMVPCLERDELELIRQLGVSGT